jgi:hypothetical protein
VAVLVTDTFDRADSDTVGNDSNGNAWQEESGDWDISSNGVIQTDATTTPGCLRCGTDTASTNHWIEARLARSTGANQIGLLVRLDAADFTAISVEVADGNYKIIRVSNGSPDTGATGAAHAHITGEVYAAEITSGNTYTLYLDGVSVFTGTEAHNAGDTRVGVHLNESASGVIRWDDVRAGDGAYPGPDWPWKDRKTEVGTSLGTSNAMPAFTGATSGDLALWCVTVDNPSTTDITGSTGWDKVVATATAGSNVVKACWFARILDGGANDILSVTSATQDYCCQGILIAAADHGVTTVTTDIEVVAAATATSGNADPPSLDTGASGDWLFLASGAVDGTTGNLITAGPTNMSLVGTPLRSANSTSCVMLGMSYLVQAGATLDPGTFENNSQEWVGQTVAIPRVAAGGEVTGTVAETQDAQTSTATGVLGYSGSEAETQDSQTSSATGAVEVTGTLAETQTNQSAAATGVLGYTGTVTESQAAQTSAATGQLGYTGTLTETQTNQTSTAFGTVGGAGEVTGTLAETQGSQTSTATGQLGYSGLLGASQGNQAASAVGWITITGTLAETQASQTATATGILTFAGTVARTQANQTAIASGWITVTGLVARTQVDQTCAATGFVGELPTPSGHPLTVPAATHQVTASGGHRVTAPSRPTALEVS